MNPEQLKQLIKQIAEHKISEDSALEKLQNLTYEPIDDFANIDHHRAERCGFPEVVFGQNKTTDQVRKILKGILKRSSKVLVTRMSAEMYQELKIEFPEANYAPLSKIFTIEKEENNSKKPGIVICCAGTSDVPVAEEAALTAEIMGNSVERIYDVGVAGLHRLLAHRESLQKANVLVVAAGMEGALPSVIAGLVDVPVIAVPTSVGYGSSFNGLAALLAMLNSCANGVAVVNIDNGFGAGTLASMINQGKPGV